MSQLHVHFTLRNLQAFQRLLDNSVDRTQPLSTHGLSNSGGGDSCSSFSRCDVNARDWLGRTVLHLACAALDQSAAEYVKLLLAHPAINVNLQDVESHWTALHRALYQGNISAALLLLRRSDTDTALKDLEGYTAFDLYNSTLEGTKPSAGSDGRVELFTWGTNRNASLGLGDADDRAYPDHVVISPKDKVTPDMSLDLRFSPVDVRHVAMSRFHTVVVTSETQGNLRVCGFGNGGRLGHCQHTQYGLQPIPRFTHTIVSVALGQDHTLAVTASGEVLSWGLNHFSQLGYVVEPSPGNGMPVPSEKPVQPSPRKVYGPLRKEFVKGAAASRSSSACWTSRDVFTWGTNNGQLGHDKVAQPVQILPRKVTKISQAVISVSITDSAMACLLDSQEVVCIWNDRLIKLNFPYHFPCKIQVYGPPHAYRNPGIAKITCCDDTFAAVSSNGELFIFTVSKPSQADAYMGIKPQRVWALRKKFTSVRDVALGRDGSIIICTESGHVFIRSKSAQNWLGNTVKTPKFQRVPNIQRITNVCANNTGAFGAIRVDFKPRPIPSTGKSLAQDLAEVRPYFHLHSNPGDIRSTSRVLPSDAHSYDCQETPAVLPKLGIDDEEDVNVQKDVMAIQQLFGIVVHDKQWREGGKRCSLFEGARLPHGADVIIETQQGLEFPVHGVVIAARCSILADVLSGSRIVQDQESDLSLKLVRNKRSSTMPSSWLVFTGCHTISLLVLINYLYTDDLPKIWDRCVAATLERQLQEMIKSDEIKLELLALGRILNLSNISHIVCSPVKRVVPSLDHDMASLFKGTISFIPPTISRGISRGPLIPNVILELADEDLFCHSVILCARSAFFADFFNDEVWTVNRWQDDGRIWINMKHIKERVMQFVLRFLYGEETIFTTLDFADSVDDVLEFTFEVMAAANELHLDRLINLCSITILGHTNVSNACYILAEATHLNAQLLVESVHGYMAANMETLLESRLLDDVPVDLIEQLATYVCRKQTEKSPVQRSNHIAEKAMINQSEWLALQDISQPFVRTNGRKHSPKLFPSNPSEGFDRQRSVVGSSLTNPTIRAQSAFGSGEDIFVMDDVEPLPPPTLEEGSPSMTDVDNVWRPKTVWSAGSSAPRVDMKTVMAEAAMESRPPFGIPVQRATILSGSPNMHSAPITFSRAPQEAESLMAENSGYNAAYTRISPTRVGKLADEVAFPSTSGIPAYMPSSSSSRTKEALNPSSMRFTPDPGTKPPNKSPLPQMQPRLGPTFTPSRHTVNSGPPLRRISGKAWTTPPHPSTIDSSPLVSGASLVAIQELQLAQGSVASNDKHSLREIQAEEEARQMEADFLKWWTAEEERIKSEEQALLQFTSQSGSSKKPKGSRRKAFSKD